MEKSWQTQKISALPAAEQSVLAVILLYKTVINVLAIIRHILLFQVLRFSH